jgi:hypothetical protein
MRNAWYIRPDGCYERLTHTEDLLSEIEVTLEDARVVFQELRDETDRARALIAESGRQKRLRATRLQLVRNPV